MADLFQVPNLTGFTNLGGLIAALFQLAIFVAGLAFFVNLIIGGIQWISAGGDPKAVTAARTRITNSFIGLAIVIAAFAITLIIGAVFGVNVFGFKFTPATPRGGPVIP
jgi:hypothetical protein